MKRWKSLTAALCAAVLLCGFSAVPAFAYADGGEGENYGDPTMTEETTAPEPEPTIEPGEGFSEEGNLVTRDLLYDEHTNKQFNVLMMTPFAADSADPKVQAFVKAYQDAYNATPDQFAADAYDAVYAVKAAVEAANGSTSGADLAAVMPTITVEGVTGTMTWSADGNTNKAASAILYKNGVGTLFGQDNANDAAGAESGDAADTAADAEA